jgi:hypothetical protein
VCDGWFPHAPPELTRQIAEHFAEWMANPPVVFYRHAIAADDREEPHFDRLAGNIGAAERDALLVGVGELKRATENSERWELIERPK